LPEVRVVVWETDVTIKGDETPVRVAAEAVRRYRGELDRYLRKRPWFASMLRPVDVEPEAPEVVVRMAEAAEAAGVGPLAAVAGAISELAARDGGPDVIVDNGGDIQVNSSDEVVVGLYLGDHPLSGRVGFEVKGFVGVCTSSGRLGHSLSFGRADAVTVFARRASVADAFATAICNAAVGPDDETAVFNALERADEALGDVEGVLVVVGDLVGRAGRLPRMVSVEGEVKPARLETV